MTDPTTTGGAIVSAAAAGAASGAAIGAIWPQPDIALLSGVFCGALVFLLRSKEPSRWKKGAYFLVSLAGGYYLAPHVRDAFAWLPIWLAAFGTVAALVAVAAITLDLIEARLGSVLGHLLDRLLGAHRHDRNH